MGQHIAMRGQDWETSVGPARISGEIAARGREPPASNGLSSVHLSSFGLRREAPRSLDDRPADYERLFDFETLFYDVFRSSDSRQVICLGPPLLNCEPALSTAMFRGPAGQGAVQWEYRPPRSQHQPTCRFRLTGPGLAEADRIVLEMAGRELDIPIRPSGHSRFAGRRVITTLSKDNPLAWIRDWAAFNVRVHGADAVLFYDNGSVNYDMAELGRVLEGVPGVAASLIIPWNFPYGPGTGPRNIQDSFYCQPGALEHARRRYCAAARAVLNTDIDELVVMASGASIFEHAEASGKAAIIFPGYWVETPKRRSGEPDFVRHSDCIYSERWRAALRRVCPFRWLLRMKWIVVPGRCPEDVDWAVHDLHARQPESRRAETSWKCRPRDVFYRHFRQIN
ncbi:MAG: hypothetical protein QOK29_1619, partial [Rhodospirillaceae bacterium]|nr:hypothetical protein [Rhodospirillaceae bacterium]